jgi:hypothetical protein
LAASFKSSRASLIFVLLVLACISIVIVLLLFYKNPCS